MDEALKQKVLPLFGKPGNVIENEAGEMLTYAYGASGIARYVLDAQNTPVPEMSLLLPSASALGASWDVDLAKRAGILLAIEAKEKGINAVIAPKMNLKRNKLDGGAYENFSEDPCLSGTLAGYFSLGLEENGVASCLGEFCLAGREFSASSCSAEIAARPLHELYLANFAYALQVHQPSFIMTSTGLVNGVPVSESDLIDAELRENLGFEGAVLSGFNAVKDAAKSIKAGVNVIIPEPRDGMEAMERGLKKGVLVEEDIAYRNQELNYAMAKLSQEGEPLTMTREDRMEEAVRLAADCVVLLKNNGCTLPLDPKNKYFIFGDLAKNDTQSGKEATPYALTNFLNALEKRNTPYDFAQGYDGVFATMKPKDFEKYTGEAPAIVFLGAQKEDIVAGEDRRNNFLSEAQEDLLIMVRAKFRVVITVLIANGPINLDPIMKNSNAVLLTYPAGEGQPEAIAQNLFGEHTPSGRLPETWFTQMEQDFASLDIASANPEHAYYDEDLFMGYRQSESFGQDKRYLPFGFGASYTYFRFSDLSVELQQGNLVISFGIRNAGAYDGAHVSQIYVRKIGSNIYRPIAELKAFKKTFLKRGEAAQIELSFPLDDLRVYREATKTMEVEAGEYEFILAENAAEPITTKTIRLPGVNFELSQTPTLLKRK